MIRGAVRWLAIYVLAAGPVMAGEAELLKAASIGDTQAVQAELAVGTPVDSRNSGAETALLLATQGNHIEAARLLIEAGADVNARADTGTDGTAYLHAGAMGYLEILKMTLDHGADLSSTNNGYDGTALIPAAEKGHVEAVKMLLDAGVDPDHVNRLGWTALMEAVVLSDGGPVHQRIVALLLNAGADPNIADGDGVTPLQHAKRKGFNEIALLLEQGGGQ